MVRGDAMLPQSMPSPSEVFLGVTNSTRLFSELIGGKEGGSSGTGLDLDPSSARDSIISVNPVLIGDNALMMSLSLSSSSLKSEECRLAPLIPGLKWVYQKYCTTKHMSTNV